MFAPATATEVKPLQKENFMAAFETINKIEDLFQKADGLFHKIPLAIQDAMRNYHSYQGSLEYSLRWGLTAAKELREDWHVVVADVEVDAE